jgi:hypothetical protein
MHASAERILAILRRGSKLRNAAIRLKERLIPCNEEMEDGFREFPLYGYGVCRMPSVLERIDHTNVPEDVGRHRPTFERPSPWGRNIW